MGLDCDFFAFNFFMDDYRYSSTSSICYCTIFNISCEVFKDGRLRIFLISFLETKYKGVEFENNSVYINRSFEESVYIPLNNTGHD